MNQQREVIYDLRAFALEGGEDLKGEVWEMIEKSIDQLLDEMAPEHEEPSDWDLVGLRERLLFDSFIQADRLPREEPDEDAELLFEDRDELDEYVLDTARDQFHDKLDHFGEHRDGLLRFIVLSTIDEKWKDHLYDLDHLKASIGFRGWGQKDPLIEYKKEAYDMFVDLIGDIHASVAKLFFRARLEAGPPPQAPRTVGGTAHRGAGPAGSAPAADRASGPAPRAGVAGAGLGVNPARRVEPTGDGVTTNRGEAEERPKEPVQAGPSVGRNDPCPCGSGKKHKKCCGAAG
jgi:preprotein translocase subunit SecA